jgi:hypothetical protein
MALSWIEHVKKDVPEWMRHDPSLRIKNKTLAMFWIIYVKTDPPEWMRHSPELVTKEGTLAMVWVSYIKTNPPEWMHHFPLIRDKKGKTVRDYWRAQQGKSEPEWMSYNVFTKMQIGCSHLHEVATEDNKIVCLNCGTGVKIYCDEMCPICREEYHLGDTVGVYHVCNHVFCEGCLEEWNKSYCPYCNSNL